MNASSDKNMMIMIMMMMMMMMMMMRTTTTMMMIIMMIMMIMMTTSHWNLERPIWHSNIQWFVFGRTSQIPQQLDQLGSQIQMSMIFSADGAVSLWLFNVAMQNGPFLDDFPTKSSVYKRFSISILYNQMIYYSSQFQSISRQCCSRNSINFCWTGFLSFISQQTYSLIGLLVMGLELSIAQS